MYEFQAEVDIAHHINILNVRLKKDSELWYSKSANTITHID